MNDQKQRSFDEMQRNVVSILKSNGLKQKIEESGHSFTEAELLAIAHRFARTYDERLQLFNLIKENATPETAKWAQDCIDWQKKIWELFIAPQENTVFELHINETPHSYDERYLCSTYEAALNMIPKFYAEYEREETQAARYQIEKRRIMTGIPPEMFDEDSLGECLLLPGGVVQSVDLYSVPHEKPCGDINCADCKERCVDVTPICFPRFLENKALVKFEEFGGNVRYGIDFEWENMDPDDNIYIVPLDCAAMDYHDFGSVHDSHQHVDAPFVEKICVDELPVQLRDNYTAYAQYLKEHKW